MNELTEYRYDRLTWPDVNRVLAQQRVAILPTGATEQHGRHLPLDVDAFLAHSVCLEVGRRAPDRVVVLPPVSYGLNLHHIDFPGTVHIEPETFVAFCLDITKSLAYHGFRKLLLVNGHGSNTPLVDLVARKTVLATDSLCAAVNYFALAREAFTPAGRRAEEAWATAVGWKGRDGETEARRHATSTGDVRETDVVAHADEFETSLYLHLAPERVRMAEAVRGDDVRGQYLSSDSVPEYPVRFSDYWGRWTTSGVHGDPTRATAEKGQVLFEAAVGRLVELVDEWRDWPIDERRSQHETEPQHAIRW